MKYPIFNFSLNSNNFIQSIRFVRNIKDYTYIYEYKNSYA